MPTGWSIKWAILPGHSRFAIPIYSRYFSPAASTPATPTTQLNPEPYAYESGLAVKWLIEAQIDQMNGGGVDPLAGDLNYNSGIAPWLAWGPYLWADGLVRAATVSSGSQSNFQNDGTHPSHRAKKKLPRCCSISCRTHHYDAVVSQSDFGDFNNDGNVDAADYVF